MSLRSIVLGAIFSAVFAAVTVYFANVRSLYVSSTQIPVMPFVLLGLMAVAINPLCRLIRIIRPFTPAELLVILVMGSVSAGISTFGLSAQVVPVMANLFNKHWNTDQTEWSRYVVPFVDEKFFVSEPGIRAAAIDYRDALAEFTAVREVYGTAFPAARTQEELEAAEAKLAAVAAAPGSEAEKSMQANRAEMAVRNAREAADQATEAWHELVAADPELAGMSPSAAVTQYNRLMADADVRVKEARAALAELEAAAFAKVELFRRGLPREQRAFPGIFPMAEDSASGYIARLRRLRFGRKALGELNAVYTDRDATPERMREPVERAVQTLATIADSAALEAESATLERRLDELRGESVELQESLDAMHDESRFATPEAKRDLEKRIDRAADRQATLAKQRDSAQGQFDRLQRELEVTRRVQQARADLSGLLAPSTGELSAAAMRARLGEVMRRFPSFDASLRRYFLGDVPWQAWTPALLRWGLLVGLTYAVLLAFNLLIFRQWAHNEKLIYPLAKLPEDLAGVGGAKTGAVPNAFRQPLFWLGVLISGGILGWNLLCATKIVPGLNAIDLVNSWKPYIQTVALKALLPSAKSTVFFTMIGLSFLIPQRISFSLWFFSILYMVQLLIICGLGYGVKETSFPVDWVYTMNFRTAEGAGAMLVFSAVVFYKCRRHIFCAFRPESVADLELDEQRELRASSVIFLGGSVAIIALLWLGMKAHLGYAIFFYIVVMLITIGLIRAVAEGGILAFQAWTGPFHLIRTLFGMDRAWTSPSLFSPLMLYYGVFFFDLKTFIAPAMANGIKIRDDLRLGRRRFHICMALAIVVAVVVAVGAEIMLGYARGADNMSSWFHAGFPKMLLGTMGTMAKTPPAVSESLRWWTITGAGLMIALLYFRQFCFWLPHPLGMIMLVNPLMGAYWFSIMIGWLAKSLVTRYGGKETYARTRHLFIGLIVGEILIVALAMILSVALGKNLPIDLNRN